MKTEEHKKTIGQMIFLDYNTDNYIINKKEINTEARHGSVVILGTLALMSIILFIFFDSKPVFITLLVLFGLTFTWFTTLYICYIKNLYRIRKEILEKTELMKSIISESNIYINDKEELKYYKETKNQDLNNLTTHKIILIIKELKNYLENNKIT